MTQVNASRLRTFDFLCKCLSVSDAHDEEFAGLIAKGEVDWPAVILMAGQHLVTPSLAPALKQRGLIADLDESSRDYLDTIQILNRERNRTLRKQLLLITQALNEIGIHPLLLKGAITLLPDQYPGAEDRVIGDLDLQVPADRLEDATAALSQLEYEESTCPLSESSELSELAIALIPPRERAVGHAVDHHAPPLLHCSLPVKVELHRRMLHEQEQDLLLSQLHSRIRVELENGSVAEVPDPNTRVLHNFLHSQIEDRLALERIINLRQMNEFSRLVTFFCADIDVDAMRNGLRPMHRNQFAEYWAQAEHYLDAHYPAELPRSRGERRERRLHRLLLSRPALRRYLDTYHYAVNLPRRLLRVVRLIWEYPAYFPIKFKLVLLQVKERLRLNQ